MPYQTPSASQYTMIKRLQTNITGKAALDPTKLRAPSAFGGYFAGLSLAALPPNAITSNKFIQRSQPADPSIIDLDFYGDSRINDVNVPLSRIFRFRFKNLDYYDNVDYIRFRIDSYDFTGSTASIEGITITDEDIESGQYDLFFDSNQLTENTIITITLPTPISQFRDIRARES